MIPHTRKLTSQTEKDVHRTDRNVPIFAGENIPHPDPDSPFAEVGTNVHMEQMKDLLLTYNEYNKELGYVQGMSDLLAPIYAVVQDDAIAFWAFQHFMERMERNFLRDQSGMRTQLTTLDQLVHFMDPKLWEHLEKADSTNFFFFFRMLLVWYKREFPWTDILRLWEAQWTDYLTSSFHLFVALAILEKHRDVIMTHLQHFDEVLKYGMFQLDNQYARPQVEADLEIPSQRALRHHRSRIHAHPRRGALQEVPKAHRGHRQEAQLPAAAPELLNSRAGALPSATVIRQQGQQQQQQLVGLDRRCPAGQQGQAVPAVSEGPA